MAVNLFDANFYRALNPDLAGFNDAQAFQHLINSGLNEGRFFSQYVDLNVYRANNPDLGAAGLVSNRQLYEHLSGIGAAEGRTFSLVFNSNVYRALNPDLAAAGLNNEQLFDHFRGFGINEGRQASESFSVGFYLAVNTDLAAAGFNNQQALQHYVFAGIAEGRIAVPGVAAPPVIPIPAPPQTLGDPFPPAGSTLSAARDLGAIDGQFSLTDFVGQTDREDYYRFVLANNSDLGLVLGALTNGASVEIIKDMNQNGEIDNGDGDVLRGEFGDSNSNAEINGALAAGTYFIEVGIAFTGESQNTNYDLRFNVASQPGNTPMDPGNTLNAALDIGFVSGERNFRDFIGQTDSDDIYRFSLNSNSDVDLTLSSLTRDGTVALIQDQNGNGRIDNGDGDVLTREFANAGSSATINQTLAAGIYFIEVSAPFTGQNINTNYDLRVSVQPSTGTINNNTNTEITANAARIDPLTDSGSLNELPGSADRSILAFNDASLSAIQEFSSDSSLDLGNIASEIISEPLGIESGLGNAFTSNLLDNSNFNSPLGLVYI
ncbi:MAG: hypothetical protein F6J93_15140 [Oscillatoria sp. SIO1A7]|nr:hypothetical protein [Oscillatoria sp. SIO1A7]